MSDTVKVIIEIDKDKYERCKERKLWSYDAEILEGAVAMGIPLDDVKAEMKSLAEEYKEYRYANTYISLCMKVIDKYIGKAESEE